MVKQRREIEKLKPYEPVLFEARYKLDANENAYDIPPAVKRKIIKAAGKTDFNRYPDPLCGKLKKTLAKKIGMTLENIAVGNGSDELISYLMQAFVSPGDRVVIPVPSFDVYEIAAKIAGARIVKIPLSEEFDLDEKRMMRNVSEKKTKMVIIGYPNNPTGNCFSRRKVENIIYGTKGLVVIDEAYFEFSGKSFMNAVKKRKNIVVLRTFSKAFSMAALRVGYMVASRDIVSAVNKVRMPYNVNGISQRAALIALENSALMQDSIYKIIIEREKMAGVIG
ncbi:MAG TPA: histidinol-phosphate transaminase, partial [Firmicutes bacterium]|nr:histidinol-phosphate transaminase [Bacillota bacterium]